MEHPLSLYLEKKEKKKMADVFINNMSSANIMNIIITILVSYFVGNISPAILLGKIKGIDIKKEGSGNAGTTNVLRILGKKYAVITLIVDILKGSLIVFYFSLTFGYFYAQIAFLSVVCGHIWPSLYSFKGGKGVATAFGATLILDYKSALICFLIVGIFVLITRRMSISAIVGIVAFPISIYFFNKEALLVSIIVATIIFIKHKGNIERLLKGTEPKLGEK